MKKANTVSALIGAVVAVYAIAVTFTFKHFKNVPVGPEFFPRFVALGLLICSGVLFVQSLMSKSKESAPTLSLKDKGMQRLLISVASLLLYTLLWEKIGFLILTPIFMFAQMYLLQMRKYLTMAIISVAAAFIVFYVFKLLLGIEMPLGLLENIGL